MCWKATSFQKSLWEFFWIKASQFVNANIKNHTDVFQLSASKKIRSKTMDSLKTLASALVFSRIDYGKMALVSLPKVATQSIQSIINKTARLIAGVEKCDHSTPVLRELRWLEIDQMIDSKVSLQMYKCLSNDGFAYLTLKLALRFYPTKAKYQNTSFFNCPTPHATIYHKQRIKRAFKNYLELPTTNDKNFHFNFFLQIQTWNTFS